MLGINLLFAGFALTLNGISIFTVVDEKVKGAANSFVGVIIAINAVFQASRATNYTGYGYSAAMWLFSLNYLIIAAHVFCKSVNWKVFGLYELFATVVSFTFACESILTGAPWVYVYMWCMWGLLWGQGFLAILLGIKAIDKFTPHLLILNGIASTFVPGFLMLLGIIG